MTTATTDSGPRLGRPRDPSLDAAIVAATLELLAEGGYTALTMEAVAVRAGVGKATLYRRWPGKEQLVVDAVATLVEPQGPPSDGTVREQLVALVDAIRRKPGSLAAQVFPRLITELRGTPALAERYLEKVVEPRHERLCTVLRRAVDEGLVRADVDLDHAVDLLVGPIVYRNLVRTDGLDGPDDAARVVDDVLRALAPTSPDPESP